MTSIGTLSREDCKGTPASLFFTYTHGILAKIEGVPVLYAAACGEANTRMRTLMALANEETQAMLEYELLNRKTPMTELWSEADEKLRVLYSRLLEIEAQAREELVAFEEAYAIFRHIFDGKAQ